MTAETLTTGQQTCFQFKASFLTCTVLQLTRYHLDELKEELTKTLQRAPNLFLGSPVVIDLEKVQEIPDIQFTELKQILSNHGMVPIGVRGGSEEQHLRARIDFPILSVSKLNVHELNKNKNKKEETFSQAKIVTTPVRSGMQVYAKDRDLIVASVVSPGAELFSDGNIHIYGVCRGRALAGVQGNRQARIFCRALEAELVSIAGFYLTKEELPALSNRDEMVQIYLDDTKICIETL